MTMSMLPSPSTSYVVGTRPVALIFVTQAGGGFMGLEAHESTRHTHACTTDEP
jgi:hypothetical protein